MTALKVIITLLLIGFLIFRLDLSALGRVITQLDFKWLLPAITLQVTMALLAVARWRTILFNFSIRAPYLLVAKLVFMGSFFNLFLPSSIGGDVFKALYLSRLAQRGLSTTLTTTVLERSGGLCALLIIGLAATFARPLQVQGVSLQLIFILLAAGYLLVNLAIFNSKLHRLATRILDRFRLKDIEAKMELVSSGLSTLIRNRNSIFVVIMLSMIIQTSSVVVVWMVAQSLQIRAPLAVFLVFIPLINLSIMVPLTINGFGLRESLYLLLFSRIGLEDERAVALSLISAMLVMLASLPGGVIYSLYKKEEHFDQILAEAPD